MTQLTESNFNSVSLPDGERLRQTDGVVLRKVAGEYMLVPTVTREVDLDSLFLLNATGVWVWEHLDGVRSVQELGETVAQHFSVALSVALSDVTNFLLSLLDRNLVKRTGANGN